MYDPPSDLLEEIKMIKKQNNYMYIIINRRRLEIQSNIAVNDCIILTIDFKAPLLKETKAFSFSVICSSISDFIGIIFSRFQNIPK